MTDKWWKKPLPALDFESTGLDPYEASIVQVGLCAVTPSGKVVGSTMNQIVRPAVPIEEGATAVHGITQERVEKEGRDPGPFLWTLCNRINKAAHGGYPLVIYNALYDLPLLMTELKRRQVPEPYGLRVVDPLLLGQKALGRRGGTKLHTLASRYGVGEQSDLHDAIQDCRLAVGVLHGLLKEFPWLRMPLNELHDSQVKWGSSKRRRIKWPWGRYDEPTPQMGFL